jgi:predicted DNA-binding transcriptional regulator AlpA
MSTKQRRRGPKQGTLHIDKRADQIVAASNGDGDQMLTTMQLANWLGVSHQFLETARVKGTGPKFIKVTGRQLKYRRDDVLKWLEDRTFQRTSEYSTRPAA